ncbi:MAG TPA: adenylate/guanylate cyclase domain-containing protein [Mariprofundaceae bacterium]|nr:adenylate/guanylate cyclase domain-containing protein [Mariprofundaceae bacterium]
MTEKISGSIRDIVNWVFSLLGLIPYLLAVYLVISLDINLTQGLLLAAAAGFVSHLLGLALLRSSGDRLSELARKVHQAVTAKAPAVIEMHGRAPKEVVDLSHSFNALLGELEKSRRSYREVTTKMILYAKDIETYQHRMQEEALLRARLGRYVSHNVVDQLMREHAGLPSENISREVTILFADIRSFTSLSEKMSPEEVVTMLNEYFDEMVGIIFRHQGVLDKFVGDELMAVFGILGDSAQSPENAIRAAVAMQQRLGEMMLERQRQMKPVFGVGIGINTGQVVIGNVGSENRMDYTVIGDAVNIAARLEQMADGGAVLVGEQTRQQVPIGMQVVEKGVLKLRNRADPVKCYEVISR